jgi:hypothetical protein
MVKRSLFVLALLIVSSLQLFPDSVGTSGRLSVYGGIGISGASGDYADENDAKPEFSFNPGLRLRMTDLFYPDSVLFVDFGYLETGFIGYVAPTDSRLWNTYTYLNLNAMIGISFNPIYLAGGFYLGIGLDSYSYREYTDEWVSFDSNGDFGVVVELGTEVFDFLTLGVQAKHGLKSIGSSVEIINWVLHGTFALHFLRF